MTTASFIIATDRSANKESMLYGWNISTVREEVIATHAGPALGDPLSFRSEYYGVLLAFCFVKHAVKYTNTKPTLSFKIYLDNKSVIKQVTKQNQYTYDYSFNTLAPDWEVIA
eukprot:13665226-Ditylum_brightwellii.AAC.1